MKKESTYALPYIHIFNTFIYLLYIFKLISMYVCICIVCTLIWHTFIFRRQKEKIETHLVVTYKTIHFITQGGKIKRKTERKRQGICYVQKYKPNTIDRMCRCSVMHVYVCACESLYEFYFFLKRQLVIFLIGISLFRSMN